MQYSTVRYSTAFGLNEMMRYGKIGEYVVLLSLSLSLSLSQQSEHTVDRSHPNQTKTNSTTLHYSLSLCEPPVSIVVEESPSQAELVALVSPGEEKKSSAQFIQPRHAGRHAEVDIGAVSTRLAVRCVMLNHSVAVVSTIDRLNR